ncbi:XTP/dITP diphosphatase [Chloroflexota bacterium]
MEHKLLLATNNKGKLSEYRSLLENIPFKLVTPAELDITTEVEEAGVSLEENARLKATLLATESRLLSLADDSGLEVDALGGEPGVMSARYAGENATDSDRVNYLLSRLVDVPREKRSARFRCVIAIATPDGEVEFCSGECRGFIAFEPKGENGFGYDPVFYLPKLGKTMAELTPEEKNRLSHRGKAAIKAGQLLQKWHVNLNNRDK